MRTKQWTKQKKQLSVRTTGKRRRRKHLNGGGGVDDTRIQVEWEQNGYSYKGDVTPIKNGTGTLTWMDENDQCHYTGEWKDNMKDGEGEQINAYLTLIGKWEKDEFLEGQLITSKGVLWEGKFSVDKETKDVIPFGWGKAYRTKFIIDQPGGTKGHYGTEKDGTDFYSGPYVDYKNNFGNI